MVLKKKSLKKGLSPAPLQTAVEQLRAAEAAILRAAEEARARLREEEWAFRQRIVEEERKILDDAHFREIHIRNAIAEGERKERAEAREAELTALLEQRECEFQAIRARMLGLQEIQDTLLAEKEAALGHTDELQKKLELVQGNLVETQERMQCSLQRQEAEYNSLQERCADLQEQLAELGAEHEALQMEHEQMVHTLGEGKAAEGDVDEASMKNTSNEVAAEGEPTCLDVETAALINVLRSEVEAGREEAARLQSELETKRGDEEKSSILVAVMSGQIDSLREENSRLCATARKRLDEINAMHALLQEEKAKIATLRDEQDSAASNAAVRQRQLELELEVHKQQVVEVTTRLEKMANDYKRLTVQHDEYVARATQREQEDYRKNVSVHATIEKYQMEKLQLSEAKQRSEDEMFNYRILTRAEMDSLKARVRALQEVITSKDDEYHKSLQTLHSENAVLKRESECLWNTSQGEIQSLKKDLEHAKEYGDKVTEALQEITKTSAVTERKLYENLVLMTACRDAKQEELEQLQACLKEKEREFTNNAIFFNAENENLKTRVTNMIAAAEKQNKEHTERVTKQSREMEELKAQMSLEHQQKDDLLLKERTRADLAERNVKRLHDRIRELQEQTRTLELNSEDSIKQLRADTRELRSELSLAKRTIERLEGVIGDHAGYKQLTELNNRLSAEVFGYRNQVAHLNSTVAAMKMEEDMMGGYKIQKTQEENELLTRRVHELERIQRLILPLFHELRSLVECSGRIPADLNLSLNKFDAQHAHIKCLRVHPACAAKSALSTVKKDADNLFAYTAEGQEGMNVTLPAVLRPCPPGAFVSLETSCKIDEKINQCDSKSEGCLPEITSV